MGREEEEKQGEKGEGAETWGNRCENGDRAGQERTGSAKQREAGDLNPPKLPI